MILIAIFVLLFACWMLFGWVVGESQNVKWLRLTCAPIFVVTAMLIAAGAGARITRGMALGKVRMDVARLLETIDLQIRTGGAARVLSEIEATDHSDDPDRDTFDLLEHIAIMNEHLSPDNAEIADKAGTSQLR